MLPLDDPSWIELSHAYGRASDIPDRLQALASSTGPSRDWQEEPWFSLWSSLCHQGDVDTASYAAVPHVVRIACDTQTRIDKSFFEMPAAIEVARRRGEDPPFPRRSRTVTTRRWRNSSRA